MADAWDAVGSKVAAPDNGWDSLGAVIKPAGTPPRSNSRRFVDNAEDALNRSAIGQLSRKVDPNANNRLELNDFLGSAELVPGGFADRIAQRIGFAPAPALKVREADQKERARRQDFERRSVADPWYEVGGSLIAKGVAAASTLGGQVGGAALSPENWVAPGKTVVGRALGNAAVGGATDAALQSGDISSGVQDGYSLNQTLGATAAGGALSLGGDAVAAGLRHAGSALEPAVRAAVDDVKARVAPVAGAASIWADLGRVVEPTPQQAKPGLETGARRMPDGSIELDIDRSTNPEFLAKQAARASSPQAGANPISIDTARAAVSEIMPGATITSTKRSKAHNAEVGGAANSWHLTGQAMDIVPPKGTTLEAFRAELKARGLPITELLDEGDHFHWAWGNKAAGEPSASPQRGDIATVEAEGTAGASAPPTAQDGEVVGRWTASEPQAPESGRPAVPTKVSEANPRDLTDQALDVLRRGQKVDLKQGESLAQFLAKNGGIEGLGGELRTMDAERWHKDKPFQSRLVREDGMGLEAAAQKAADAGYFLDIARPEMGSADNMHPVTGDMLLEAIRRELAGDPRYAGEPDPQRAELAQHANDLEEMLNHLGVDPRKASNAEVRQALDDYFSHLGSKRATVAHVVRGNPVSEPTARSPRRMTVSEQLRGARLQDGDVNALRSTAPAAGEPINALASPPVNAFATPPKVSNEIAAPQSKGEVNAFARAPKAPPPAPEAGSSLQRAVNAFAARLDAESARGVLKTQEPPNRSSSGRIGSESSRVAKGVLKTEHTPQGSEKLSAPVASRGAGLRGAQRPSAVSRGSAKAKAVESVSTLARKLKIALGLTTRQGRMTLKKALGEYDTKSGVIRTKIVHELDVVTHEGGHALEYRPNMPQLQAALKAHATELKAMAYPGADKAHLREEGFAEWFRWFVTNPAKATAEAPAFEAAFIKAMEKDAPAILADLQAIRAAYKDFLASASPDVVDSAVVWPGKTGALSKAKQSIKERGLTETVKDIADEAYTNLVDRLHPVKMATRELLKIAEANTGRKLELKTAEDPYRLSRLATAPYTMGQMDVLHGVTPYKGVDPKGPSLAEALSDALGKDWGEVPMKQFGDYLAARRMIAEWARYKKGELAREPHGTIPREVWAQTVADYDAANPHWKDAAKKVYAWTTELWRKQYESGLIGKKAYENGLTMRDYVPLMRDVSDKRAMGNGVKGDAMHAGGVKEFKGSSRDVISPIVSLIQRAQRVSALIERNEVFRALDDLAEKAGPGAGAIIERIPDSEASAINVDVIEALEKAARDAGYSEADYFDILTSAEDLLGPDRTVPIFQSGVTNPRGEPIIFLWKNGKRVALRLPDGEFGKTLFNVLAGLQDEPRSLAIDMLSRPAQVLRFGVTMSPDFMVANYIRDQVSAAILSDVGYKPFLTGFRGLTDELSQSDFARRYYAFGGARGGANTAALQRAKIADDVKEFRAKGYLMKRLSSWRGINELTEVSERSTRLGLFRLAYQQAKRQGLSDFEAVKEAAFTSRDILDFDRYGSKMLAARRIVTFMNAGLQGLDKMSRVITAEGNLKAMAQPFSATLTRSDKKAAAHAYKALSMMVGLGFLGASLSAIYKDDPEYQEASDYLRATHWMFKTPDGAWVSIPKPFELAVFSNIAERAVEAEMGHDTTAWNRMYKGLLEIMVPPHEIPALAVPVQVASNRDQGGRPIVPDHLRGKVDPEFQFNSYTTETAKALGHVLKVSPAVVDHVIGGVAGTMGRYALKGSDAAFFGDAKPKTAAGPEDQYLVRRFVRDITRQSTSQKQFWDLVGQTGGKLTQAEGSFRLLNKSGDDQKAKAYLDRLDPATRQFVLSQVMLKGAAKNAHPLARARDTVSTIAGLRRDLIAGNLTNADASALSLTPTQRRDADNALSYLAMTEMRNALVRAGYDGWKQKAEIPRSDSIARLNAVDPRLGPAVEAAYLRDKILPEANARSLWGRVAATLTASSGRGLDAAMLRQRASSREGRFNELARRKAAAR